MNHHEAVLLRSYLDEYRTRSYQDIEGMLGSVRTDEVRGLSGTVYQLEVEVFEDEPTGGNLRVRAAIDGGGITAFCPLIEDFIIAPDGTFVGEDER
jgi:hypothetical protein